MHRRREYEWNWGLIAVFAATVAFWGLFAWATYEIWKRW